MPDLFIDLDGTLIDSRPRQYQLFMELAPHCPLDFDAYWRIKRRRINQEQMLRQYCGVTDAATIENFHAQWMRQVEEPARLALDHPLPDADAFLARAVAYGTLYLVTARQSAALVAKQIAAFGWSRYFTALLVTEQRHDKATLMRSHARPGGIVIGDTGEDIRAAKALGLTSIAVTSGILDGDILREYAPDRIVTGVGALALPLTF